MSPLLTIGLASGAAWLGLGVWRGWRSGWFRREMLPGEMEAREMARGLQFGIRVPFGNVGPWVDIDGIRWRRHQRSWVTATFGLNITRATAWADYWIVWAPDGHVELGSGNGTSLADNMERADRFLASVSR